LWAEVQRLKRRADPPQRANCLPWHKVLKHHPTPALLKEVERDMEQMLGLPAGELAGTMAMPEPVDPDDMDEEERVWHEVIATARREASEPDSVEVEILMAGGLSHEEAVVAYWQSEAGRRHRAALAAAEAEARTDLTELVDREIRAVTAQAPAQLPCGLRELAPAERPPSSGDEQGRAD
jgi:hypothetical protein